MRVCVHMDIDRWIDVIERFIYRVRFTEEEDATIQRMRGEGMQVRI